MALGVSGVAFADDQLGDQRDEKQAVVPTDLAEFNGQVQPFLTKFCTDCHGEFASEADFRLDNLDGRITDGKDSQRWEKALEMITIGDMPPEDAEAQPTKAQRQQLAAWIKAELAKIGRGPDDSRLIRPEFGNRVNHEDLFSGEFKGPAYSPSRLWRKNRHIQNEFESILRFPSGTSPFAPKGGKGFQDYSLLLANEATIKAMRINAANYATELLDGKLVNVKDKDGKPIRDKYEREGKSRYREFNDLIAAGNEADDEQLQAAIQCAFELLLFRKPSEDEVARYQPFLREGMKIAGDRVALEYLINAIVLSPEFIYRQEIGLGEELPDGRRMLSPHEIAYALAYALTDSPPDEQLQKAVEEGRLSTKADVEREVRRMLETDTHGYWGYEINHTFQRHVEACPNPRILRFFREFFGYSGVFDVFKDQSRNSNHKPEFIFKDADLFVLSVLEDDKDVLKQLLTSNRYVVHYVDKEKGEKKLEQILENLERNKKQNPEKAAEDIIAQKVEKGLTPVLGGYRGGHYYESYNLAKETWDYPLEQPFALPHRMGMLTHPAWLVSHSGNFDTDPIRRGKWIREHLLADTIPDIPIGVDAALEDNPHKSLREKLAKTTQSQCWRCHKKMNPLGLPFEAYDDFGRYREHLYVEKETEEIVGTEWEMQAKVKFAQQRKQPEVEFATRPIDTTGALTGTEDPKLDGDVKDAADLLNRLAKSDRVRQSFIRHVFRYWMGRNETLDDSPTLMAADKAYVESDGSFKELLVSLLTSDSFLMRKDVP